ncbi:hypothetical protein [Streptomyces sp. NPDC050422]|uniref:hypothetical protein n=1 Tax=Streptomyces sp. NPDC050422 TaxID=3365614 RepID=UPI0037ADD1E7
MTLWDVEIDPYEDALLSCSRESLESLALEVIKTVPEYFDRPLDDLFDRGTVALFRNALEEFQAFSGASPIVVERWNEMFKDVYDWQDSSSPFIAASLVQGLGQFADLLLGRSDGEEVLEVLSSCYESVLSSARLGRAASIDDERRNPNCRAAVSRQVALIQEACGR